MKKIKEFLGKNASEYIQDGMLVALGSGSTAKEFIKCLAQKCKGGLKIHAIASSKESENLAKIESIPLVDEKYVDHIDIMVDGADEVDHQKRMIKGRGGALLREKILASFAKEIIILIDETKLVEKLGKVPLPVEIVPFGAQITVQQLEKLGYKGSIRVNNGEYYITDNGNLILDIQFNKVRENPEIDYRTIKSVAGVVEVGFFFNLASKILIGYKNERIESL